MSPELPSAFPLLEWVVAREEVEHILQPGRSFAGSANIAFSHFESNTEESVIGATVLFIFYYLPRTLISKLCCLLFARVTFGME